MGKDISGFQHGLGGCCSCCNPGGGGGPPNYTSLFQQIIQILTLALSDGGSKCAIDILTVGTANSVLYQNSKYVRKAIIQNLSSTDTVTLGAQANNVGKVATIAAGSGILLNPAPASGQGGGSLPVGNCDLGAFTAVTNTNNNQSLAVYYEY